MPNTPSEPFRSQLFTDASGRLVETTQSDDKNIVSFCAQGGGFVYRLARDLFEKQFSPAELPGYRLAAVAAGFLPENVKVPAYTDGHRWNGWAMPYFSFEAATELASHMPGLNYDSAADAFVFTDGNSDSEDEADNRFPSETLNVDGTEVKVYGIGTGSWTWDLVDSAD